MCKQSTLTLCLQLGAGGNRHMGRTLAMHVSMNNTDSCSHSSIRTNSWYTPPLCQ